MDCHVLNIKPMLLLLLLLLLLSGYAAIIFEKYLVFNKTGVGLFMAVSLWVTRSFGAPSTDMAVSELMHASAEASEIVFFLLSAMTIVEIIDAHQGFKLITDIVTTQNPHLFLWVIGFVTFFLSAILDNLTCTIVMISLLRRIVLPSEYRNILQLFEGLGSPYFQEVDLDSIDRILGAAVVIAANAGGAWTPMGDVTTTMLLLLEDSLSSQWV
ncbi:hypothetical protein RJT34_25395 [Clitoria ternatea]|uniref:Citrate transporter-like domain-containing protein n=1 Tax=Clitoria ternatea TaxID=43366 RepID=A0AAN9FPP2_CLITE